MGSVGDTHTEFKRSNSFNGAMLGQRPDLSDSELQRGAYPMIGQEGQEYNAKQGQQRHNGGSATIRGCDVVPQEGDAGPRRARTGAVQCLQGKSEILLETGVSEPAGLKLDSGEADPRRARVTQSLSQG